MAKKKRGRKSNISIHNKSIQNKISTIENNPINVHNNDDIIIHLKIKPGNLLEKSSVLEYSPTVEIPLPDSADSNNQYKWINDDSSHNNTQSQNNVEQFSLYSVTNNEADTTETKQLPHTKNIIKCFWCCHSFSSEVCYLPIYLKDEEYVVYGTFCSPECCAAYNFNDTVQFGNPSERYSLLHSLYYDQYKGKKIQLAPSRLSLQIFGGKLSIEDFRKLTRKKDYKYSISISPIRTVTMHHSFQTRNGTNNQQYNLQRN